MDSNSDMWIQLTRRQVVHALMAMTQDIWQRNTEGKSLEVGHDDALDEIDQLNELHDRYFIRHEFLLWVDDHTDVNWLWANNIRFAVLSSKDQLLASCKIRIRIFNNEQRRAWKEWLES